MISTQIKDLEIQLGSFHLGPLQMDFEESGLYFIRGKNGSGKTSLLRTLMGRIHPQRGSITGLPFPLAAVGIEGLLMSSWTVEENLRWFSGLMKLPFQALLFTEIKDFFPIKVFHLSLGMRKQVELLLSLNLPFSTLLLDEPFSSLDSERRSETVKKILKALDSKRLIILTSHYEDEIEALKPIKTYELS